MTRDTFKRHAVIHVHYGAIDHILTIVCTLIFWRFVLNLSGAVCTAHQRGWTVVRSLNAVPNLVGVLTLLCVIGQQLLPGIIDCTLMMAVDAAALSVGLGGITAVLLARAYYSWMRERWLLHTGSVVVAMNVITGALSFIATPVNKDPSGQCWIILDTRFVFAKAAVDMATNLFLSGMYLIVLRRMMRGGISAGTYAVLYREGMVDTLAIIASSWLTLIVMAGRLVPGYDAYIYGADLAFSATVINHMLARSRQTTTVQVYTTCATQHAQLHICEPQDYTRYSQAPWETVSMSDATVATPNARNYICISVRKDANTTDHLLFSSVANVMSSMREASPHATGQAAVDARATQGLDRRPATPFRRESIASTVTMADDITESTVVVNNPTTAEVPSKPVWGVM
ncbi:hypothetical protein THASP1DRAFT_29434 [Thamnocephalis sphaerospora]|uniref:Uncharacterized protein n=1 Tax=Thamnocephalis sphaerospora TaxID=78915 RepID=A0A4P9XRP8_9FUNG|nr:hypothetical protein THASP1DRAFT_29434 [Thamnocephalis sphaerospora]|eukprot:RKP08765.1 hypothetical protein THASP1DRAFT_29434 [Thamnocephalis sphaerospora]